MWPFAAIVAYTCCPNKSCLQTLCVDIFIKIYRTYFHRNFLLRKEANCVVGEQKKNDVGLKQTLLQ